MQASWKETGGMFVEAGEDWQDEFGGETDEEELATVDAGDGEDESLFSD